MLLRMRTGENADVLQTDLNSEASMTSFANRFSLAALLLALLLGWFAITTIIAEALTPAARTFAQNLTADAISGGSLAGWAAAAVKRGDLLADMAMARAAPVLRRGQGAAPPDQEAARGQALATAQQSLSLAPHSSATWLLVAMLQNQAEAAATGAAVLKMSYLTSLADISLVPSRLALVSSSAAIADGELRSLARGDIRLILTRRPDLKPAITSAYRDGSADGRTFIQEVVQSLDPGFAASLR